MNWYDVGTMYTWENSLPQEFVNTENLFCGPENCSLSQPSSIFNIPENSVTQIDKNKAKTKSVERRKKEKQSNVWPQWKLQLNMKMHRLYSGVPWWFDGKEFTSQCRRCRFDPWGRKWQLTPVVLPRKSLRATVHGVAKESWLSD